MADNTYTTISKDRFRFVQQDEKIHDKALKTKPIGYFKDAWIRFRKNKASVAAAIVLAIIILYAIIVPFVSRYKLGEKSDMTYKKMNPEFIIGKTVIFDGGKNMSLNDKYLMYLVGIGINAENAEGKGAESWNIGFESFFNPVLKLGGEETVIEDGKEVIKRNARVSTYQLIGYQFLQVSADDLAKILDWEKEHQIQVLYPLIDESSPYGGSGDDANLWYRNSRGYPINEAGQVMNLEQVQANGFIDNFLRDSNGELVYMKTMGSMYKIRVLYYNYYQYEEGHAPSFVFGSDGGGYDIATRMAYGLRTSFVLSVSVAVVCFVFGAIFGAIEGYYGGWVDMLLERLVDILWRMPLYIIVTLFQMHLVNTGKASVLSGLLMAFCVTGWIGTASLVRTQFYRFKNQEYILAARTLGAKDMRLMFRHIFPNAIGTIITSSVFVIPSIIMSESTFSYLGIVNLNSRDTVSLGTMMADGKEFLSEYPHILLIPAAVIALMMIAFNLFGNGLRDAFNPSLRGADD
ncbi:MAG: ABC transporter permease [Clostridia bacterium]|nr:ABC transporter permease [Clostridia bacterium]